MEYTRSKSTIEQLMRQRCPQMPLTIARPSIVVGHTRPGCQPSSSIFWVFGMALMLRKFMCSLEDNIDVIPADYCADALVMLMNSETLENDVYHISAGVESSVSFAEIDNAMAAALEKAPVGDEYAQVTYDALVKMRRQLKDIFGPCNERLMLKAMRLYGSFAMLNVRFSNEKILAGHAEAATLHRLHRRLRAVDPRAVYPAADGGGLQITAGRSGRPRLLRYRDEEDQKTRPSTTSCSLRC